MARGRLVRFVIVQDEERYRVLPLAEPGAGIPHEATEPNDSSWLVRKFHQMGDAVHAAEGGVLGKVRDVWHWLQRHVSPDEPSLRRMRHAPIVELYHPPELAPEKAQEIWRDYLRKRHRKHLLWFTGDVLISPITVILAPLPGPNLIGYWFVYRAVCHMLAWLGIRRARLQRVPMQLQHTPGEPDGLAESLPRERESESPREVGPVPSDQV
jgi:hypothetical protein